MSTATTTNPVPPALIVFGTRKGATEPCAAWFRSEYAARARSAAQRQGLAAIAVNTDETRAAAKVLNEGQLKAGGQLVMPSVSQEVLDRLRNLVPAAVLDKASGHVGPTTPGPQVPASCWDALKPTDIVLGKYFDKWGDPEGWWEAVIIDIQNNTYTIRWVDEPETGFVRLPRKHVALMFPG